jgi:hypothetical protein
MTVREIEDDLLSDLYPLYFTPEPSKRWLNSKRWAEGKGLDPRVVNAAVDDLLAADLIHVTTGVAIALSNEGAIEVEEKRGLVSPDLVAARLATRDAIVEAYVALYEREGPTAFKAWVEMHPDLRVPSDDFQMNVGILLSKDLLEWPKDFPEGFRPQGKYRATAKGRQTIRVKHLLADRSRRFRELGSTADVARRGHELEQLLLDVVRSEGWEGEPNVRGPGEENDLVINQGMSFFLVECRWRKKRTEASGLGGLHHRVTARAGARGLFVSMSGYTSGALKNAEDRLEGCVIVLFGPKDVADIIEGRRRFTDLLTARVKLAMSRRKIAVDE